MNDQQVNVAIHEARNLPVISEGWVPSYSNPDNHNFDPPAEPLDIPDYCNDLNAMHDAVQSVCIDDENRSVYVKCLDGIVARDCFLRTPRYCTERDFSIMFFPMINATSHQRAESFLRTLGKWVDS